MPGIVHLVGAGPGDPGLITVRGRTLLASCDCLVHDYLVSDGVLALANPTAARHYVGKRGHAESATQDDINSLLVELAGRYRQVVRLKGGDPFVFGRGGEECAALAAAGVRFTVVPGVTSGIAAPAYAGIPVTHRATASAVAFVTGHTKSSDGEPDWAAVARIETLVLYMGMHRLERNCAQLVAHGRSAETPAAIIQWGTHARQRVVVGTLATLPGLAAAAGIGAPAITVVGDVVSWRERIAWADDPITRPLGGRRILVTRAAHQASPLGDALAALGAETVHLPLQRTVLVPPAELAAQLELHHAWLAFTSANAVAAVWAALRHRGQDARALATCRLAAVGSATATALAEHGLVPEVVGPQDGAALAEALLRSAAPSTVLLPQADNARPELARRLSAAHWTVTPLIAYRMEGLPVDPQIFDVPLDAIALGSAATVQRLVAAVGLPRLRALTAAGCRLAAIGPRTAEAAVAAGLPAPLVARDADVASLAGVLADAFRRA